MKKILLFNNSISSLVFRFSCFAEIIKEQYIHSVQSTVHLYTFLDKIFIISVQFTSIFILYKKDIRTFSRVQFLLLSEHSLCLDS